MRNLLKASLVLGLLVCAAPVMAQMTGAVNPGVGAGQVLTGSGTQNVALNAANSATVVNWSNFNMGTSGSYVMTNNTVGVVNNVTNSSAQIYGSVLSYTGAAAAANAGGNVYFYCPGGIVIGKGATIQATNFLAAASPMPNNFTFNNFQQNMVNATNAANSASAFPVFGFEGLTAESAPGADDWAYVGSTTLRVGDAGSNQNLWIIGTVEGNKVPDYGIGAYWLGRCQADAYKNIATLTSNGGGTIFAHSGARKMWLGTINTPNMDVTLSGSQIWLPRITANGFWADGGVNQSALWNCGVWVYGNVSNPLTWNGKKPDNTDAVNVTGNVDTWNMENRVSADDIGGGVFMDGAWVWVHGNINATDNAFNAGGSVDIGDQKFNNSTVSIWTNNINTVNKTNGDAGWVGLDATGTVANNTPCLPGLGTIKSGTTAAIWTKDITTGGLDVGGKNANVSTTPAQTDFVANDINVLWGGRINTTSGSVKKITVPATPVTDPPTAPVTVVKNDNTDPTAPAVYTPISSNSNWGKFTKSYTWW